MCIFPFFYEEEILLVLTEFVVSCKFRQLDPYFRIGVPEKPVIPGKINIFDFYPESAVTTKFVWREQ
jgi:hypothetical protein